MTTKYFDLIRVHGSVGDENLGIFNSFGLVHTWFLVQQETSIQEGVCQCTTLFLDDLNGLEVARAFETKDGIDGNLGKEFLVLCEDFRAQCCPGNVHEIISEFL